VAPLDLFRLAVFVIAAALASRVGGAA